MNNDLKKILHFFYKLRGLGSISVANIVAALTMGFFWLYMATILNPEDYGIISYLIAVASLGGIVASLGVRNTIIVYSAKKETINSSLYFVTVLSGITMSIVLYVLLSQIEVSVYAFSIVIFGLITSNLLGHKHYFKYSMIVILQKFLFVILAVGFYYLFGINGLIFGMGISYLVFAYRLKTSFSQTKIDLYEFKKKFKFMITNHAYILSRSIDTQIDKIIILPILGYTAVGNYSLAMQFLILAHIIPKSAFQYLLPQDSSGRVNKKLKIVVLLLSACTSLIGIFFGEQILQLLFPEFTDSQTIVQILSLAIVPISLNFILQSEFLSNEKSNIVLFGGLILISTHLLGIVVLGTIYGIHGIAIAYVLGTIFQSIFFLTFKKIKPKNS